MTREQAVAELVELHVKDGDTEIAHWLADRILKDLLVSLGYEDVVREYEKVDKWYA